MTDKIKPESTASHGDYERRDIGTAGIVYFILGLAVATIIVHLVLAGLYDFLDKRARTHQPPVNALIENVPTDTRQLAPRYAEKAFPEPRLETDERGQLNNIRLDEERTLNSYGWVNEKAGTVRIPIERAMDLEAQRLPVRSAGSSDASPVAGSVNAASTGAPSTSARAGNKKKGSGR
jgi:hypothetical protein